MNIKILLGSVIAIALAIPGLAIDPPFTPTTLINFTTVSNPYALPTTTMDPSWLSDDPYVPLPPGVVLVPEDKMMVAHFKGPILVEGDIRLGKNVAIVDYGMNQFGLKTYGLNGLWAKSYSAAGAGVMALGGMTGLLATGESYGIQAASKGTAISAINATKKAEASLATEQWWGGSNKHIGVYGQSDQIGVYGETSGNMAGSIGVAGYSSDKIGVHANSATGTGLYANGKIGAEINGSNASGTTSYPYETTVPKGALFVKSTSLGDGDAITGIAKGVGDGVEGYSDGGWGVFGESHQSIGVYGRNPEWGLDKHGVKGDSGMNGDMAYQAGLNWFPLTSNFHRGSGVKGMSDPSPGVIGLSTGSEGVLGVSVNSIGVAGYTKNGQSAIYGHNESANSYSGFFSGGKGVKIENALILEPVNSFPNNPEEGTMVVKDHFLFIRLSNKWLKVWASE